MLKTCGRLRWRLELGTKDEGVMVTARDGDLECHRCERHGEMKVWKSCRSWKF